MPDQPVIGVIVGPLPGLTWLVDEDHATEIVEASRKHAAIGQGDGGRQPAPERERTKCGAGGRIVGSHPYFTTQREVVSHDGLELAEGLVGKVDTLMAVGGTDDGRATEPVFRRVVGQHDAGAPTCRPMLLQDPALADVERFSRPIGPRHAQPVAFLADGKTV